MMATMTAFVTAGKDSSKILHIGEQRIRVWDHGKGPALLLLHGMFGDYLDWEPVLEPLAKNNRVIAVDLPGFGDSSKPRTQYTGDFFTDNIDALLEQLNVQKVNLAGNSFGGIIAMLYVLGRPDRVNKLVLVDSGGLHHFSEEEKITALTRFSEANLKLLTSQIQETIFGALFLNGSSPVRTRYIEKQNAKLSRNDFADYTYSIHHCIKLALDSDLRDRLCEIKRPTLLLQGGKDLVVQVEWVREARTKFPNAELKILPDCGHIPQLECGEQVIKEMERFLATK
jgi:pimeloyl-ACP methyl ester carboxylesterase